MLLYILFDLSGNSWVALSSSMQANVLKYFGVMDWVPSSQTLEAQFESINFQLVSCNVAVYMFQHACMITSRWARFAQSPAVFYSDIFYYITAYNRWQTPWHAHFFVKSGAYEHLKGTKEHLSMLITNLLSIVVLKPYTLKETDSLYITYLRPRATTGQVSTTRCVSSLLLTHMNIHSHIFDLWAGSSG